MPTALQGGTLRPYQLDGLRFLLSLYNNCLNGASAAWQLPTNQSTRTCHRLTGFLTVHASPLTWYFVVPCGEIQQCYIQLTLWCECRRACG